MPKQLDNFPLRIAVIRQNDRGNAKNVTMDWKELRDRLATPHRDRDTTFARYQKLSVDAKGRLKDVGAFVGGPFKDGIRKANNINERSVVTLDVDSVTPTQVDIIKMGLSGISEYEFFGSTTRSHTAENPRWRLVLPTSRTVSAEEYAPLARIIASKIFDSVKESMDATDEVSFRVAQIMYWPSVSSDGLFESYHNVGRLVDPDEVLDAFGDWRDWTILPFSEKFGQKRPTLGRKAENPREKDGIIGAFCRAYDIPAAIEKFIPDVYLKGTTHNKKPRYTYAHGSGSNGAVVEDDGLFLYSHHGTDPCGDRLVNAFDMVRLHLFGHEDVKSTDDLMPSKLPSFKAFTEFITSDEAVAKELLQSRYDLEAMFDDVEDEDWDETDDEGTSATDDDDDFNDLLGESPKKKKPSGEWMKDLEVDLGGLIKPTLTNVAIIMQNDKRFNGVVEMNDFTQEAVTRKAVRSRMSIVPHIPVVDKVNGDLWSDRHDYIVRAMIEAPAGKGKSGYGLKVTDRDLKGAIDLAAGQRAFHPVRDYLNGLEWDGKKRMEKLFIKYLGAKDTAYTRGIAKMMLLGGVTRVFEPGHKFDFVVILEGLQGKGKSTFIRTIGRNWFVELEGDLHDRKSLVEKMQGAWILEIPELSGFGKAEIQSLKAIFSASHDKVRLAYDKRGKVFMRQCIFIGSTNDAEYLRDPTGGRRFWPVMCEVETIDNVGLDQEMDQIWAEALVEYRAMREAQPKGVLPLYLSDSEAAAEALAVQESRRMETVEDTQAGMIEAWLNEPVSETTFEDVDDMDAQNQKFYRRDMVSIVQIWVEMFGKERGSMTPIQSRSLNAAMKLIDGWTPIGPRMTKKYGTQRCFRRDNSTGAEFAPIINDDLLADDLDDII